MQTVHQMASAILQRDPTTHDADSIASIVMKFFDQDMREAKLLQQRRPTRERRYLRLLRLEKAFPLRMMTASAMRCERSEHCSSSKVCTAPECLGSSAEAWRSHPLAAGSAVEYPGLRGSFSHFNSTNPVRSTRQVVQRCIDLAACRVASA